jgi:hypothetical protein
MIDSTRIAIRKLDVISEHLKASPRLAYAGDADDRKISNLRLGVLLHEAVAALDANKYPAAREAILEAVDVFEALARRDVQGRRRALGHD